MNEHEMFECSVLFSYSHFSEDLSNCPYSKMAIVRISSKWAHLWFSSRTLRARYPIFRPHIYGTHLEPPKQITFVRTVQAWRSIYESMLLNKHIYWYLLYIIVPFGLFWGLHPESADVQPNLAKAHSEQQLFVDRFFYKAGYRLS